jgi:hypothetical protein
MASVVHTCITTKLLQFSSSKSSSFDPIIQMNYLTNFPASNFMTDFEIVEIDNETTRIKECHEENVIFANQVVDQILFDFPPIAGLLPGPGYQTSSASEGEEDDSEDDISIESFDIDTETETEEEEEEEEGREEEENEEEEEEGDESKFYTPLPHPPDVENRPEGNPIAFQLTDPMDAPVGTCNNNANRVVSRTSLESSFRGFETRLETNPYNQAILERERPRTVRNNDIGLLRVRL